MRKLLEERGIEAVEAGGSLAPAQHAFCAKICSKIITSQFCVVLMNNEEEDGKEIPNPNVNMEYGLMLGFNKYVIPFQRKSQALPFNVAGLDTIKYTDQDFERLATEAIDQAIKATSQEVSPSVLPDQIVKAFLLTKKALFTPLQTEGDQSLFQLGNPLGFNLLNDFSGMNYMYFGNFTSIRPEIVIWRLRMLKEILDGRRGTLDTRIEAGIATEEQVKFAKELLERVQIWVLVLRKEDKQAVDTTLDAEPLGYETQVFFLDDLRSEFMKLAIPSELADSASESN